MVYQFIKLLRSRNKRYWNLIHSTQQLPVVRVVPIRLSKRDQIARVVGHAKPEIIRWHFATDGTVSLLTNELL